MESERKCCERDSHVYIFNRAEAVGILLHHVPSRLRAFEHLLRMAMGGAGEGIKVIARHTGDEEEEAMLQAAIAASLETNMPNTRAKHLHALGDPGQRPHGPREGDLDLCRRRPRASCEAGPSVFDLSETTPPPAPSEGLPPAPQNKTKTKAVTPCQARRRRFFWC